MEGRYHKKRPYAYLYIFPSFYNLDKVDISHCFLLTLRFTLQSAVLRVAIAYKILNDVSLADISIRNTEESICRVPGVGKRGTKYVMN